MNVVDISNWAIVFTLPSPYSAPELGFLALHGLAHNHPSFESEKNICSTRIVSADYEKMIIRTTNTEYHLLGSPSVDWSNWLNEKGFAVKDYFNKLSRLS